MQPRLKPADEAVKRFKDKVRDLLRAGRGKSIGNTIATLTPLVRGWVTYFRLAEVKGIFEELDGVDTTETSLYPLATMEAGLHTRTAIDTAGIDGSTGVAIRHKRTRPLVQRRSLTHERAYPQSYFAKLGLPQLVQLRHQLHLSH